MIPCPKSKVCCCPEKCPDKKAKTADLSADRAVGEDYGELEYFSEAVKGEQAEVVALKHESRF